jgi:glyoxylate/hydroxypyruvate reductase A
MRILLHRADGNYAPWLKDFAAIMPEAEIVQWQEGAELPACDYAVCWAPPAAMLPALKSVKAIFLTGAGADGIMKYGSELPDVPIVRLGDAGMAIQMAEYVMFALMRYYRRFDEYVPQARRGIWQQLPQYKREEFSVGIMGPGVLGSRVIEAVRQFDFPVRTWSRSPKQIDGVESFHGMEQLPAFLGGTRVLVCMLPLTPDTTNLLDKARLSMLPQGAYLINVARGAHVAEPDLLALIKSGHIAGATLDVFRHEPLPAPHPFWEEPRIIITPHMSAMTLPFESVQQIADKLRAFERNEPIADVVDRKKGY